MIEDMWVMSIIGLQISEVSNRMYKIASVDNGQREEIKVCQ